MATLVVPNRYSAVSPIIVTSPTTRCGTTLVQRLISASDNAFIFGEEVGHQIRTVTAWFIGLVQQWERTGEAGDSDFEKALAGELDDWRPGLTPPTAIMQRAWVETLYGLPVTFQDYARSVGRPVWGFKGPSYPRDAIKAFLTVMPQAKVIYVFRNLYDVLKSAKARRFAVTDEEVAAFCAEWAQNMKEVSELAQDERLLFLKYEALVAQKAEHVRLLELFTGAQGVREAAFDLKVNTYTGEEAFGYSPRQYIEPAELTAADRAAVLTHAGPILNHLYGDLSAAA